MKSIFEIENRLNIQREFYKLIKVFHKDKYATIVKGVNYSNKYMTLKNAIQETVFLTWKYRDTFLDVDEYLENLGIKEEKFSYINYHPDENIFLLYLEFIINMYRLLYEDGTVEIQPLALAAIENIPLILEKMNYQVQKIEEGKLVITKRDADVDVVLDKVPENISDILLQYNDFRIRNDLEVKRKLLKDIDLYIEKNINIKSFDKELDDSIGVIVNKMGVNHPINEEPYNKLSEKQLLEWYDKCFVLMLHAIRMVKVKEIKEERKILSKA